MTTTKNMTTTTTRTTKNGTINAMGFKQHWVHHDGVLAVHALGFGADRVPDYG